MVVIWYEICTKGPKMKALQLWFPVLLFCYKECFTKTSLDVQSPTSDLCFFLGSIWCLAAVICIALPKSVGYCHVHSFVFKSCIKIIELWPRARGAQSSELAARAPQAAVWPRGTARRSPWTEALLEHLGSTVCRNRLQAWGRAVQSWMQTPAPWYPALVQGFLLTGMQEPKWRGRCYNLFSIKGNWVTGHGNNWSKSIRITERARNWNQTFWITVVLLLLSNSASIQTVFFFF